MFGVRCGSGFYGTLVQGLSIDTDAGFYEGYIEITNSYGNVVLQVNMDGHVGWMPSFNENTTLFHLWHRD